MARTSTNDTIKALFTIKGKCREPDGSYIQNAISRYFQNLANIDFSGEIPAREYLEEKARAFVGQWIIRWKINKKLKHPCFNKKINYKELATVYGAAWDAMSAFKNLRAFTHANKYNCTSQWFACVLSEFQLGCASENPSGLRDIVSDLQTKTQILTDIKNGRKDCKELDKLCNKEYALHTHRFFKTLCNEAVLDIDANAMREHHLEYFIKVLKSYSTHVRTTTKLVIVPSITGDRYVGGRGRGYKNADSLLINLETLASIGFYPSNDHFESRL